MSALTFGSLFAGIGGFDLGFERAGMQCVWQVEKDEYARKVLAKYWPDVRRWDDVCTFPPEPSPDWSCDVICGGFPCQDISVAGKRAGIDGKRSGLWREFARIIRILRPRYVVVENVAALLVRGMGRVLGDLAEIGYDAEWSMFSAFQFGARHIRKRMFLISYPFGSRTGTIFGSNCGQGRKYSDASQPKTLRQAYRTIGSGRIDASSSHMADAFGMFAGRSDFRWPCGSGWWEREPSEALRDAREGGGEENGLPIPESLLGRVADGIPSRVDRLKCLGNAVVPQIAEYIGRRIIELES